LKIRFIAEEIHTDSIVGRYGAKSLAEFETDRECDVEIDKPPVSWDFHGNYSEYAAVTSYRHIYEGYGEELYVIMSSGQQHKSILPDSHFQ